MHEVIRGYNPLMLPQFFHERPEWPHWRWSREALTAPQDAVVRAAADFRAASRLLAPATELGLSAVVDEAHRTSLIEGERLDREEIRTSLIRRQNLLPPLPRQDARIAGLLEMTLDARRPRPMTPERLKQWHAWLFAGLAPGSFQVGEYRTDQHGPMQIISHRTAEPRVVYEAPPATQVEDDIDQLLSWLQADAEPDPFVRAGVAHLWFEAIHPFEDGNGRIGRSLVDWILNIGTPDAPLPISLSVTLHAHQAEYYAALDQAVRGDGEITPWLCWFLTQLETEMRRADAEMKLRVMAETLRVQLEAGGANERQLAGLNRMARDWIGHMTTLKWGKLHHCSAATAQRDLAELVAMGFLIPVGKGRSAGYVLRSET